MPSRRPCSVSQAVVRLSLTAGRFVAPPSAAAASAGAVAAFCFLPAGQHLACPGRPTCGPCAPRRLWADHREASTARTALYGSTEGRHQSPLIFLIPPQARNVTLPDLAAMLRDQQARKVDIVAPASAIRSRH